MTFEEQREWMVRHQLEAWGIADPRVLDAMRRVPRELFVPDAEREAAYYDGALPIGEGQTISQPFVVAHMTETLRLQGSDKALEIGTGSGYQTAVLSLLAAEVYTVERIARLSRQAQTALARFGVSNVHFLVGEAVWAGQSMAPMTRFWSPAPRRPFRVRWWSNWPTAGAWLCRWGRAATRTWCWCARQGKR
jgi:protein-L-isoaspartate(D-aspartate) O-methyltransferase